MEAQQCQNILKCRPTALQYNETVAQTDGCNVVIIWNSQASISFYMFTILINQMLLNFYVVGLIVHAECQYRDSVSIHLIVTPSSVSCAAKWTKLVPLGYTQQF